MIQLKVIPLFIAVFISLFIVSLPSQARWATYADAPAEVEFYNSEIVVDKDGNSVEIVERQIKILNESGRNAFGVARLQYNENQQKIEIIEAKTIINGKEYVVPKDMIEIKPIASEVQGFDQLFQILISFPHLAQGSSVYVKYKLTERKQPLPNYFAYKLTYGGGAYWKKAHIKIKSELPLQLLTNDPSNRLDVKQSTENKYCVIEVTTKKEAFDELFNESPSNQVPDSLKTWISVSSYKTFEDLAKAASKDYESVINQALPPLQEAIRKEAAKATNSVDQINTVTSLLNEKIRYMGDWRTVEGRYTPRSLKAVADSGVGDCKDFSASTIAILRSLGYKAQAAIVMRGMAYIPPEKELPSYLNFNHAIAKITDKDGKVFWIDATNFASMAGKIFPDISYRHALVIDSQNPSYEQIPMIEFQNSGTLIEDSIEIKENDILSRTGSIKLMGEEAQPSTGAGLAHSLQCIEEIVIKEVSGESCPLNKKVTLPPLNSRIVKDLTIGYSYEQENSLLLTNEGLGILLNFLWSAPFIDAADDQEGTTFVGLPTTLDKKTLIKNADAEKTKSLTYNFKTPWIEARRDCRIVDHGVEIHDHVCILKSFITAEEVKSKQFKELRGLIKKYCNRFAVIITKMNSIENKPSPLATGG
jgi:transglutaminase-like putative cysteine protease